MGDYNYGAGDLGGGGIRMSLCYRVFSYSGGVLVRPGPIVIGG